MLLKGTSGDKTTTAILLIMMILEISIERRRGSTTKKEIVVTAVKNRRIVVTVFIKMTILTLHGGDSTKASRNSSDNTYCLYYCSSCYWLQRLAMIALTFRI